MLLNNVWDLTLCLRLTLLTWFFRIIPIYRTSPSTVLRAYLFPYEHVVSQLRIVSFYVAVSTSKNLKAETKHNTATFYTDMNFDLTC
jgi:hypothetical protein